MMTVEVQGQLMGVVDERREFVDREKGETRGYQKRTVRVLVGSEFVVVSAREGVSLPDVGDVGKKFTVTLSAFSNEKDVVRGTAVKFATIK